MSTRPSLSFETPASQAPQDAGRLNKCDPPWESPILPRLGKRVPAPPQEGRARSRKIDDVPGLERPLVPARQRALRHRTSRREWAEIYAATAMAGLIAVPINFRLVGPEIQFIVENCEAQALIVQEDLLDEVESVCADLPVRAERFISFGGRRRHAGYRVYEDLIANARDEIRVRVSSDDPWTLITRRGPPASRRERSSATGAAPCSRS